MQIMYVLGTQKDRLDETVVLITQNTLKLMDKKIFTILHLKNCISLPMGDILRSV